MQNKSVFGGFTLAEVLITLGIIGIVAAMTLPALIQKNTEKATVAQLKKSYSILSQAYLSILSEHGSPDGWGLQDRDTEGSGQAMMDKFAPYLKIAKNCGTTDHGCFSEGTADAQGNTAAKALLADGSAISIRVWSPDCSSQAYGNIKQLRDMCGFIEVDVNGLKRPNAYGIDRFRFFVTKTSIFPYGTSLQSDNSSETSEDSINFAYCARHKGGAGCTAWVLYNENMDYLRCSDLSWDGKKTCR